jgi:hypothetical protein
LNRRRSECLRNLDDPLKVFSLLTIKSCGLVVMFYAAAVASELVFGIWSVVFGPWSFLGQLGAAGLLAIGLAIAEKHEDEHFVPSAARYYLSRRWRILYGGACGDDFRGHSFENIEGGPWRS